MVRIGGSSPPRTHAYVHATAHARRRTCSVAPQCSDLAFFPVHTKCGNYAPSHALTWGGTREPGCRPMTIFPCRGHKTTPSEAQVWVRRPAEARCVDRRRSASRLGVRSTGLCARDVPRPGRGTVRLAAVATVARHSRGEICGSIRPAPDGRSPYHPAEAATRPPPWRRHLGARPNRP